MSPLVTIVMPAYNEQGCIENVVAEWLRVLDRQPGLLCVVNDGSRDRTGEILDRLAQSEPRLRVIHQPNSGHGAAVRRGYEEAVRAGTPYVFQTDSDDQFFAEDFFLLWQHREAAVAYGVRAKRADPIGRKIISRTARLLCWLLFKVWNRDANSPFRLFRAETLRDLLGVVPPGMFAPNILLLVAARRAGVRVREIEVRHRERKTGVVSILRWKLLQVCLRTAGELLAFREVLWKKRDELRRMAETAAPEEIRRRA